MRNIEYYRRSIAKVGEGQEAMSIIDPHSVSCFQGPNEPLSYKLKFVAERNLYLIDLSLIAGGPARRWA